MLNLRLAVRSLWAAPVVTGVAVLTIALGIGATTAIFTIVNALLIRPLPYADADRLVMVWQDLSARGGPADEWLTPGNFADWRAETSVFENLAALSGFRPTLTSDAEPESIVGEQVTYEYFSTLGLRPAIGRDFGTADDVPNAARVAIIGDGLWRRRFGSDPAILGRTVILNGEPHEVIGVMPAAIRPIVAADAEIWRPMRLNRATPARGAIVLRAVGRLAPSVTLEGARAAAAGIARRLEAAYPDFNEATRFTLEPLLDRVTGQIRPGLLALLGAVAFVLLIACANIANLLLARGSGRGRELAVRVALGAGRPAIVRQLLTESLFLAAIGGAAGVILAYWMVQGLLSLAPPSAPRLGEVSVDATVMIISAVLTLLTGVLFGLAPILQYARVDVTDSLKEGGRGVAGGGGRAVRRALITAEVALALILLAGGSLLVQTFVKLQAAELGFRTEGLLVGLVNPPRVSYDTREKLVALYDRLLEQASALPGAQGVALTSVLPLDGGDSDTSFEIEGRPPATSQAETPVTWYRQVSASYFDVLNRPIRRGRGFAPGEAAPSVVVNESFVRTYFAAEDPIGRRIRPGGPKDPWYTIVGVVGDARVQGARASARVETFIPYWQTSVGGLNVVVRGDNPAGFTGPLRQAVLSLDRNLPLTAVRTMEDMVRASIGEPRFFALLAAGFAALALLLAAVGIYGVMAYTVSQRRAEIGVRVAMGATRAEVFRMVVADGLKLAAIGVVIGIAGALLVGRWLSALLFGVGAADPVVLTGTAATLAGVAVLASLVPAWRAMRADPVVALRAE